MTVHVVTNLQHFARMKHTIFFCFMTGPEHFNIFCINMGNFNYNLVTSFVKVIQEASVL